MAFSLITMWGQGLSQFSTSSLILHEDPSPSMKMGGLDCGYFRKAQFPSKIFRHPDNGGYGAFIDNCLFSDVDNKCFGSGTVSLLVNSGYDNTFENNAYSGLSIKSKGAITTYNLIANGNGQSTENAGVILDNDWNGAAGGVAVRFK